MDYRKQWVFVCDICWPTCCVDNPHYEFGGTWVSGRIVKPESQIADERRQKRQGGPPPPSKNNENASPNAHETHETEPGGDITVIDAPVPEISPVDETPPPHDHDQGPQEPPTPDHP